MSHRMGTFLARVTWSSADPRSVSTSVQDVAAGERADLHGQARRRDVDADVAPLRALSELRGDVDLVVRVRPAHRARGTRDDGDAAPRGRRAAVHLRGARGQQLLEDVAAGRGGE